MPTKPEVLTNVIKILSVFSGLPESKIRTDYTLTNRPLSIDSTGLTYVTMALRAYIRSINSEGGIAKAEVSKSDLTVQQLSDKVYEKINT